MEFPEDMIESGKDILSQYKNDSVGGYIALEELFYDYGYDLDDLCDFLLKMYL